MVKQIRQNMRFTNSESGMTLIEVAMGMIILGLLAAALLPFYRLYKFDKIHMTTLNNIGDVSRALTQYALVNDGYPLPADRDLTYGDANYGYSAVGPFSTCTLDDDEACRLTGTSDKAGPAGNDPVLKGDIPFATLGLPYTSAIDGFGNRLTYAVSEYLTIGSPVTFDDENGVIRIQDETGNFTSDTLRREVSDDAHFVIISHGRNGMGAFTRTGVLRSACDTADTSLGRDRENCDLDAIFTNNFIVYTRKDGVADFTRTESAVAGAAYYDDYVKFSENLIQGTWLRSSDSIIGGPIFAPNSSRAIKVGAQTGGNVPYYGASTSAYPHARFNVVGANNDLVATQVNVNRLCDLGTSTCNQETHITDITATPIPSNVFNPAIIGIDGGGNDGTTYANGGGINCGIGSESIMRGIKESEEFCYTNDDFKTKFPTPNSNTKLEDFLDDLESGACPPFTWTQGIDATGKLICITP